jgi:hypothetical protein
MLKVLPVLILAVGATSAANAFELKAVNHQSVSRDATTAVATAPEIDPASAVSAFTLLAGGLAVIRGRRSSKKRD